MILLKNNGTSRHSREVHVKRITTIIIIMTVSFAAAMNCAKKAEREGITVHAAVGEVKLMTSKGELAPKAGDSVSQGDAVMTGKASMIDLVYADRGIIRISENSNVKIETLISDAEKDNARLGMEKGKLIVTLSRLRKNSSFEVKASTSVAAVRGTTLRVTADEKSSRVDVVKGKVSVTPVRDGNVIPEAAAVVEENQAVNLDVQTVNELAESKKAVEVTIIPKEEAKAIREEIKSIPQPATVNAEVIQETREIISAPAVDETAEREKLERERREKESADRADRARLERERAAQAARAAQEKAAREAAEKAKQAVTRPQTEKKEQKNIPLAPNL